MSEPIDISDTDKTDDPRVSAFYERASREQPTSSIDDAILSKAQRELEKSSRQASYYPDWTQSLSIAAVLVMSVSVIFLMDEETPAMLDDRVPAVAMEPESAIPEKMLVGKLDRLEEKSQAKAERPSAVASAPQAPVAPMEEQEQTAMFDIAAPEKAKVKARKKKEIRSRELDSEASRFARSAQAPQSFGIMADLAEDAPAVEKSCQQLSEKNCLNSAACTLKKAKEPSAYQCVPAINHCELMFRQSEGTKETCEEKQGCEFIPANCYCAPNTVCVCGGGSPATCRVKP